MEMIFQYDLHLQSYRHGINLLLHPLARSRRHVCHRRDICISVLDDGIEPSSFRVGHALTSTQAAALGQTDETPARFVSMRFDHHFITFSYVHLQLFSAVLRGSRIFARFNKAIATMCTAQIRTWRIGLYSCVNAFIHKWLFVDIP